jgi:DNA-binding transcriptional LysR family regulator
MLDARQLRHFIAVAEELSFARAADRLNVAQSAVSLQIKGLEEAFGARLLNRRKRAAVSLTEAGRLFLSEAVAAIRQLERAEQVGHLAARGELGQIEVGYVTSVAMNRILPSLLREYRQSHPAVQLRLTAMDTPRQLDALAEGRLDAALIRPRPGYAAGVAACVIHRETLCVALAADHPLARSHTLQAAELGNEAFIVPHVATFGSHLEGLAAAGRFPIKIVHDIGDFVTALSMAAAGYGVVLGPESMCGFGYPEVAFRPLADFAEKVELAVAFRTAEPCPLRASAPSSIPPSRSGGVESSAPPVVSVRRQRSIEVGGDVRPGSGTDRRCRPCVSRSPLKVDPQYFRAVPEVELPRSMNAAYSRLGFAGDERSKLNRMTRQRGTRECSGTAYLRAGSCRAGRLRSSGPG